MLRKANLKIKIWFIFIILFQLGRVLCISKLTAHFIDKQLRPFIFENLSFKTCLKIETAAITKTSIILLGR